MSLFGLASVVFNKDTNSAGVKGPLKSLEVGAFTQTTLRYPIDVGAADKAHYMVFYIREQKNTKSPTVSDADSQANEKLIDAASSSSSNKPSLQTIPGLGGIKNPVSSFASDLVGKLNNGLNQLNSATGGKISGLTGAISQAAGGLASGIDNLFGQKSSIVSGNAGATTAIIDKSVKKITGGGLGIRTTRLTKDAIALYMPDTLQYTHSQSYDQLSVGSNMLGKTLGAGSSVIDKMKNDTFDSSAAEATIKAAVESAASSAAKKLGGDAGRFAFTATTGKVENPMLEMIYRSPNFRTFQFDFTFYPRDEKEAYEVQKIVETFKYHQAPEVEDNKLFLIPPSEFDIRFYYGGAQNPNIPSIATCILTTIDVNYAPNGFTTYEVPGETAPALGRTGMPVAIQLNLQFQEVTFLTKADFKGPKDFKPSENR